MSIVQGDEALPEFEFELQIFFKKIDHAVCLPLSQATFDGPPADIQNFGPYTAVTQGHP